MGSKKSFGFLCRFTFVVEKRPIDSRVSPMWCDFVSVNQIKQHATKKRNVHLKKKNVCGNLRRVRCIPARRNYDQTAFRKPSREKYVAWRGQIWSIGREGKVWKRKKRKIYGNPTTAPRNKLDANHETLEFQMQRFRGMLVVQITLFIRLMHTPLITENQLESTDNYICVKFMEANIVVDR